MKKFHNPLLLLLSVLFVLYSGSGVCKASYDHFQLVYTWPNTFCLDRKVECKKPVPQNFMVHGLWPADREGESLVYCSKTGSISSALSEYGKQLANAWPSIRRDITNRQFWQHQWNKHGTCALPRTNVLGYLQLIISQKRRLDLLRALSTHNINPNGSSYPRNIVESAIRRRIGGANFYVSCQGFINGAFIKEIYVCLDGNGHEVISCPPSDQTRGCGRNKNLVFPAANKHVSY